MTAQAIAFQGLIEGRVQGVFFRAETLRQASSLQLTGWVRNTAQGHVEVLLCGLEADVNEMIAWLHHGPALARVERVTLGPVACPTLDGFEILV